MVEPKACIRNEDMDYAIARHYKDRKHVSAASLKLIVLGPL